MPAKAKPEESRSGTRYGAVLVVTCVALAAVVSAMASLNVALPSIARTTHASQTQLSWIIDAYSLIFASLLLPGGAIGDRFGRRRALFAGLTIFGIGSAVAASVHGAEPLIVLRGMLGVGGALVMPATLSTITSTFPRERRGAAVGVWAAVAGGSALIGLLVSGALLETWSWRAVFMFNVVLAVIAVVGTLRYVPESADPDAPAIDVIGALIATVGLIALVYSIIEAPEHGWASTQTLVGIGVGVVVLVGFIRWELHTAHPLIDPRLFRRPAFAAGTLSISLQFFGFFGFVFVAMQYLQLVRGDSPMVAALSVTPMAATMMPSARFAPKVVARVGSRRCVCTGLAFVAVGLTLLGTLDQSTPYWRIVVGLVPLGTGMGLAMTPATTAVTDALPRSLQGVGSAMNDLSRELGGALGIAVLGSLLAATYRSHLALHQLPPALAVKARASLAVAARLGPSVLGQARTAFTDGMHVALFTGAGIALATAAAVLVMLRPSALPVVSARREARQGSAGGSSASTGG